MSERGREAFVATGRGGAGNMMRSPSRGRDAEVREESGRQAAVAAAAPHVTHAGRGGAGNVRSPSRDPVERKKNEMAQREEALLQQKVQASDASHPHTTGRGGAGNIKSNNASQANSRDHSEDRGRGRNGENGSRGGPVGNVLRSLSRSRSRDARANDDSPSRGASSGATLPQVDETSSTNGSAKTDSTSEDHKHHQGLASKIAAHLPGHHHKS